MHSSDPLSSLLKSKVESKLCNPLRVLSGDHFQALNHSRSDLMFQASVLSLSVLSDDNNVHVLVAGGIAWDAFAMCEVGKEPKAFSKGHVERLESSLDDGGE